MTWFEIFKSLHLIFMVTWFAGLFYLPRLFVYHAMSSDQISIDRFKIMERKLYFGIMTPGMVLTLVFGTAIVITNGLSLYQEQNWLLAKVILIILLIFYHIYCGKILNTFKNDTNTRSHVWYRWFNEIPVVFLFAIVFLAVSKSF